ncbi:hypothetical protein BO1005MUT1_380121 [Hyphomicrobiales bacterium]|nr:hypothetical protein BO1005MUT1_380121 [Hyphomicrobiales bacterium]
MRLFHEPAPRSLLLQARQGDEHADHGEVRRIAQPHHGSNDPPDLVDGREALPQAEEHLPIGFAVRPSHGDGKRMQLPGADVLDVAQRKLERVEMQSSDRLQVAASAVSTACPTDNLDRVTAHFYLNPATGSTVL